MRVAFGLQTETAGVNTHFLGNMLVRSVVLLLATAVVLPGCAAHNVFAPPPVRKSLAGHNKQKSADSRTVVARKELGTWIKSGRGVRVAELSPRLKRQLVGIARHFGKPVHVTSGCRSSAHNRRVGGVNGSFHIRCLAADFNVPGVPKQRLASYVRKLPARGGVGVYCGKSTVHLDLGPRRNWYKACGTRQRRADPIVTSALPKTSEAPPAPRPRLSLSTQPAPPGGRGETALGDGIAALLQKNP